MLIAVAAYLSYLPSFNVRSVRVQGAESVAAADIAAYADSLIHPPGRSLFSPSNIFLYHPDAIASAIVARFPPIQSAKVDRPALLANDVSVTISERTPFALWCDGGASSTPCYEMDKDGFVFAPEDGNEHLDSTYTFSGGLRAASGTSAIIGSTFAPGHFQGILAFLLFLADDGFAPQGASVVSDTDFSVPLPRGYYLKASFGENAEDLAKNLQLILTSDALKGKEDQLLYVDLRFGDRVYYKFKTQAASL